MIPPLFLWCLQTNNCIVAATAIPAASAPSFPSVTSITESLSLTQNRSSYWRYSLCYESADDMVIGLLHCNNINNNIHKYAGHDHSKQPDPLTQRPSPRVPDLS